jgi:membrane protein YqaA with SNARE-associated domain
MTTFLMLLTIFAASVVSSLLPIVNAEALLLGSVLAAPPALTLLIVTAVAVGQVIGKVVLYRSGKGIGKARSAQKEGRTRALVERLSARPGALRTTLLTSAVVGLPPLYAMAVVSGVAGLPAKSFVGICLAGRFVRFYALALLPELF